MNPENTFTVTGFVLGATEMAKKLGVPSKFLPIVAVVVGAVVNPIVAGQVTAMEVLGGAFIGMTTSGVVSLADRKVEKYTTSK